jgi:hypothetical protein
MHSRKTPQSLDCGAFLLTGLSPVVVILFIQALSLSVNSIFFLP